ncbi:MAG: SDR family NAD(P)-dependent oxidoreductase, partial [Brasilonema sp.]
MKKIIMASLVALATTSGFLLNNQPVQAHSRRYDHSLPHGYYPFYRSPISYCYPVTHWLIDEDAAYHRTKGWMHSFMLGVAVEQAKHGVRANCICPGAIDTAWTHKKDGPMNAKMEKTLVDATPMARRGTPEEIANVYAFIASDEASYVT